MEIGHYFGAICFVGVGFHLPCVIHYAAEILGLLLTPHNVGSLIFPDSAEKKYVDRIVKKVTNTGTDLLAYLA